MDLNAALAEFDVVDSNLTRLEGVWAEMQELVPQGIQFAESTPDGRRYQDLVRVFAELLKGLPPIGETQIDCEPWSINDIARARFDLIDSDEPEAIVATDEAINECGRQIDEYRFRFNRARAELVRARVMDLVRVVDSLLPELVEETEQDSAPIGHPAWDTLSHSVREIRRLVGTQISSDGWGNLFRHVAWGQGVDLHDIARVDWPLVRPKIESVLYAENEPLPIHITNLADLVKSKPTGPVSIELNWSDIDESTFERLLFNVLSSATGYQNVKWLMKTKAPDQGRDISAQRVSSDSLTGSRSERVFVQARHLLTKSVTPEDVSSVLTRIALWEPPPIHVLIMATSGRFTAPAVEWIEDHNNAGKRPHIEMWPESHLELLLSERPHIAVTFGLRKRHGWTTEW